MGNVKPVTSSLRDAATILPTLAKTPSFVPLLPFYYSMQLLFVTSATGLSILQLGDDLSPVQLGSYTSMVDFGSPTSVAYSSEYDELAISVANPDPLTKGRVYIVSSVEGWVQ